MNSTLNNSVKRVALYLRVSTDDQWVNGHGLDVQMDVLRKACENRGYILDEANVYSDPGLSGSLPITKRPGLQKLFEDAEKKQFDVVLVYRLDRFFRNLKQILSAVEKLKELSIAFRSATEDFETESVNGELMFHIIASFSHHERRLISSRMSSGRERAAKENKWVTGVPPYGYKVNKERHLEIVEEEAKVVRQFYEWLVYEKCSMREICKRANEMKMPAPKHKIFQKRKTFNYWWRRTVNRILLNEVYTGEFYYRKYKRPFKYLDAIDDEQHQRPKDDWIRIGGMPPIISRVMFEASIKQLKENRQNSKRNTKRPYLYSKLIYCGHTGLKLQSGFQKPTVNLTSPTLGKYYHAYVGERR